MGERLPYKQRVGGSSPSTSTINKQPTALLEWQCFFKTSQMGTNYDIIILKERGVLYGKDTL